MKVQTIRASLLAAALVAGLVAIVAPAWAGVINEDFKLMAVDGAAGDEFGYSIAIDNGVIAVGSVFDDDNGASSGSAYLFDVPIVKLLPSDGATGDHFGFSIAIDNGVVAVGAPDDRNENGRGGSAYLFDASTGVQIAKLLPSDGATGDNFGTSIAIHNGVVAVGAWRDDDNGSDSGSAYLFDASTGAQIAKLLASDGESDDQFGSSIAIHNGIVAVGAPDDENGNGFSAGSAYLFDASTGVQRAKLISPGGDDGDFFGTSIAIHNGVVAVGVPGGHGDKRQHSGSAYLFDASTGTWMFELLASDGVEGDFFGISIAIDNGVVGVGAYLDDENGTDFGSGYLFDASTGAQIAKLLPSDGAGGDWFGWSIAIDNGVVAVGARADNGDNGDNSGSAYVFNEGGGESCTRHPEWLCDGDVDGDGQVNPVDSGIVQANFGNADGQALCNYDVDCDGQINPVDSGIVQSLFGTCEAPRETCP